MTSGASATNSAAYFANRVGIACAPAISIRTLRPSVQPNAQRLQEPAPRAPIEMPSSAAAEKDGDTAHTLGLCAR